jgi:hypothetical protein
MSIQSFETTKVPILGLSLRSPEKKYHLDVAPAKSHKVYYREGSGASSKGYGLCKACS